jgi:hypothetical protein
VSKSVLAIAHAKGYQLLEQICKRYGADFNIEIQTLRAVVIANTKMELFRGSIRLLEEGLVFWIKLASADSKCFITETILKPGIVNKVYRSVKEIRLACIRSEDVKAKKELYCSAILNNGSISCPRVKNGTRSSF